jgi:hypothetical protein
MQPAVRRLEVPPGLSSAAFHRFVAASIQQAPIVQYVYEATARNVVTPQGGQDIISSGGYSLEYPINEHWNTVKEWLLYFLPWVYRQPYGSNNLQRGAEIGEWRI